MKIKNTLLPFLGAILTSFLSCNDGPEEDWGSSALRDRAGNASGIYQAEDRDLARGCRQKSHHPGFTGEGYMDFGGNGAWIEWKNVKARVAGKHRLNLRYANGGKGDRGAAVIVNGQKAGDIAFSPTGRWRNWQTSAVKVTLATGSNTIRVEANTDAGGPNLDRLKVINLQAAPCQSSANCSGGMYCQKETGQCDAGEGVCVPLPECSDLSEPVCGCDGETYSNRCSAASNGAHLDYPGECDQCEENCDPDTPPNIVVILADDLGHGDVSYHPHPVDIATPHIDRLADAGVTMTNGYANSSVCAPTRASFLTGRYSQRYGFFDANDSRSGLPTSETTVADLLKQQGYTTGIFGKWHCGTDKEKHHPLNRGFDKFYGFLGHGGHDYFNLDEDPDDEKWNTAIWNDIEVTKGDQGYLTDILGDKAVSFIKDNQERPFFLVLPFNAVHTPLQAPAEDIARFNTGDKNRDIYLAMLYRMDLNIGRVIDTLKTTGNFDNTLLFFFSDNGGVVSHANNMPLKGGKHTFYEGGIRVPFLVSWPDQLKPGKNDSPVLGMDIFQTICSAAGIELPNETMPRDGRDMMPLLKSAQTVNLHDYMFWDRDDGDWAVRKGKWKLHRNRKGDLGLFDLSQDAEEENNLIDKHPSIADELEQKYKTWRNSMPPKLVN